MLGKQAPLSRRTLGLYALPNAGVTAMHWLILIYLLKFATDELGLAPALVGGIFAAGRLWDAFSDPVAGYASDRTRTRMGRRRPWMFASALPLGLAFYALWSIPPHAPAWLSATWLGASLFVVYGSLTAFQIPYRSLGAELSSDHHERTRISAARVGVDIFGMAAAIAGLQLLENAANTRDMASALGGGVGCLTALSILYASLRLREPMQHMGRGAERPLQAFRDVMQNPHAIRVTAALFFAELGLGSLLVVIPYASEALIGEAGMSATMMLAFIIPFALSIPLWVPLTRRFGKVPCWIAGCAVVFPAFAALSFVNADGFVFALVLGGFVGLGQAAMRTIPPSVQADVIDWDEARTGQRKEGSYFAVWNLCDKLAGSVSVALVGFAIQGAHGGVDPEGVHFVISTMPAAFVALSLVALLGLRLDANEHRELQRAIAKRTSCTSEASSTAHASAAGHGRVLAA